VLVVSVYVEGGSDEALEAAIGELDRLIRRFRDGTGMRTDVVLAGDSTATTSSGEETMSHH
jgi:hypothetical protein